MRGRSGGRFRAGGVAVTAQPNATVLQYPEALGGYQLEQLLGMGATGAVFRSRGPEGAVALKVIHPHLASDPAFARRIEHEAQIARTVRSRHTVPLIGAGTDRGYHFLAMELVDGPSLAHLLRVGGPLPVDRANRVFREIVAGLADLHAAGIVHRDVKPSNVLMASDGRVLLTDYGISQDIFSRSTTTSLDFAGTLCYAAPEQAGHGWDYRVDIYAAGATLVHLLTGSPPERHGLLAGLPRGRGRTLAEQLADVDPRVAAIAERCLQPDPEERYATAKDLLAAIEALPSPGGRWHRVGERLSRGARRLRRRTSRQLGRPRIAVTALVLVLLLGGALVLVLANGASPAAACEPEPPANVQLEQGKTGQVIVTWQRSGDCAPAGYRIAYGLATDREAVPAAQVLETGVEARASEGRFTMSGLEIGSAVSVWVEAYDRAGRTAAAKPAEIVVGQVCNDVPPPPSAFEVEQTTPTSAKLVWKPGSPCTTGYTVYYSTGDYTTGADFSIINPGQRATDGIADAGNQLATTIPGLKTGELYSFWVRARSPGGRESATPAGPLTARLYTERSQGAVLTEPAPGAVLQSAAVDFRWTPGRNIVKYSLWISSIGFGRIELFQTRDGPELSAHVEGLPLDGRTIYVQLWAQDGTDAGLFHNDNQFVMADQGAPRVERTFELAGTQPWLDTGISFQPGDRVQLRASGKVYDSPSDQKGFPPDGGCGSYPGLLVPALPCMGLMGHYIGVAPFAVGSDFSFFPLHPGTLVLGINDSEHRDNHGSWTVTVRVTR